MGIVYHLQCESCWNELIMLEEDDFDSIDAYDEAWEKLNDELDPIFPLFWGEVNIAKLHEWTAKHKEHGEIVFGGE